MTSLAPCIVLVLVLPIFTTNGMAMAAQPATPFPEVRCTVEPRTIAELHEIGTNVTDTSRQLPVYNDDELPRGRSADPDTEGAVAQTLLHLAACLRSGEARRMYAPTTDGYILGQLSPEFDFSPWPSTPQASTPQAPSPLNDVALQTIHSMDVLDDARIAVTVTFSGVDDPHPAPGRTFLMLFANVEGRWLLDAQYYLMRDNTYVADLVGIEGSGTPTP